MLVREHIRVKVDPRSVVGRRNWGFTDRRPGKVLELKEAEGRKEGAPFSTKPDVVTERLLFNAATLTNQVKILAAAACDNASDLDKSVVQT